MIHLNGASKSIYHQNAKPPERSQLPLRSIFWMRNQKLLPRHRATEHFTLLSSLAAQNFPTCESRGFLYISKTSELYLLGMTVSKNTFVHSLASSFQNCKSGWRCCKKYANLETFQSECFNFRPCAADTALTPIIRLDGKGKKYTCTYNDVQG